MPKSCGYVVPMPRDADALGRSLRRVFAKPGPAAEIDALLCRLDAIG